MKKINRLLKNEEFKEVIDCRNKLYNQSFTIYYSKNNEDVVKIGLSASKKLGIAVLRNKIKRQVRMMIDDLVNITDPYKIVIIITKGYLNNEYEINKNNLKSLISKIVK